MGTAILGALLELQLGSSGAGHAASVALLGLAWMLLLGLSGAFVARAVRDRGALTETVTDPVAATLWGTVSMALLATGSATLTVLPAVSPALTSLAARVDAALWAAGTLLGVVTALGFTAVLVRQNLGEPHPTWGLPVVPPMVSATVGAGLVPRLPDPSDRLLLLAASTCCFVLALVLGGLVFGVVYHHLLTGGTMPRAAAPSTWIPLGIVGQSAAAAQSIATHVEGLGGVADAYGCLMLALAAPVGWFATVRTVQGFRSRMPFAPGWWALTFPIGTLSLGTHLLGASTGQWSVTALGWVCLVALCGTWSLCATATVRAVLLSRARAATAP